MSGDPQPQLREIDKFLNNPTTDRLSRGYQTYQAPD